MASYNEIFLSKMDWAKPFQRTNAFPLDRSELFASYADAVKYAKGDKADPDSRGLCGTSYVGQIIGVFENDVVKHYAIQPDRTLAGVGGDIGLASSEEAGVIKIGYGLEILEDGTINVTGAGTADAVEWDNILNKPEFVTGAPIITDSASTVEQLKALLDGTELTDGMYTGVLTSEGEVSTYTAPDGTAFNSLDFIVHVISGKKLIQLVCPTTGRVFHTYASATSPIIETTNQLTVADLSAMHVVIDENYVHTDNNFTDDEKAKLETLAVQVQSDWSQAATDAKDYIKNKPILSTVATTGKYADLLDVPDPVTISTDIDADGESIKSAASPKAVKDYVTSKITSTYKPAGSVLFADLPVASEANLGYVYNIQDAFVTDERFIDYSTEGTSHPAGTNVAVVLTTEGTYMFDCMSGIVDLSGYAQTSTLHAVATSGSYEDLINKPVLPSKGAYTLTAGETSAIFGPFTGDVVSVLAKDAVTNEVLGVDVTITSVAEGTSQVEVAIASPYENNISVTVAAIV